MKESSKQSPAKTFASGGIPFSAVDRTTTTEKDFQTSNFTKFPNPETLMAQLWVTRSYTEEVRLKYAKRQQQFVSIWSGQIPLLDCLWLLYACYEVFRENMTAYVLATTELETREEHLFFRFDLVAAQFSKNTGFNGYFFLAFGSLAVFYLYALLVLQYSEMIDFKISAVLLEMVAGSWEEFWRWNPQLRFELSWSPAKNWATGRKLFRTLKTCDIRFSRRRSQSEGSNKVENENAGLMTYLTDKQRLKVLLTMLSGEVNQATVIGTSSLFLFIGTVTYTAMVVPVYGFPGIRILWFTVHMFIQAALNLHAVKLSLFLALTLKTQCTVYRYLFGNVYTKVKDLYEKCLRTKRGFEHYKYSQGPFLVTSESHDQDSRAFISPLQELFNLRALHWRFLRFTLYFNDRFLARVLFTSLLLTLPSNVYMITFISLHPNSFINTLFIVTVISLQFLALLMFILPMIQLNASIYAFRSLLVSIQLALKSAANNRDKALMRQKVKLLLFYEQSLHHCGFTVGPLAEVTSATMFKFIWSYCGYLLYMLVLLRNEQS